MDTYEVLSLLFLGGSFLLALLAYIDRINKRKKISHLRLDRTGDLFYQPWRQPQCVQLLLFICIII